MNNIWTREKDFYSRRPIPASSEFETFNDLQNQIALIRGSVPIVDLVRRYLKIHKPGRNWFHYVWLCPFHPEKTPSFWVSPMKGIFHCWGCWAWWDAIRFVQRFEWVKYGQAVNMILRMYKLWNPKRFAKVYKKRYFDILSLENENWETLEFMEFLQDEVSMRVRDVIYAEKEEKYARLHWRTLEDVISEKPPKQKKQCFHNH